MQRKTEHGLESTDGGARGEIWSPRTERSRDTARLEAFSDAVIAIMLTLLSLQLPEIDLQTTRKLGLPETLLRQWPTFMAFLITYLVVGQIWITHHNIWRYIDRVDQGLLVLNLLLLLSITVVPFSARLLAEGVSSFGEGDRRLAVGLYAASALGQAVSFNLSLWWARRRGLLSDRLGDELYHAIRRRFLIGPSIYLLALATSLLSPALSIACYVGVAALYVWPGPGDLPSGTQSGSYPPVSEE